MLLPKFSIIDSFQNQSTQMHDKQSLFCLALRFKMEHVSIIDNELNNIHDLGWRFFFTPGNHLLHRLKIQCKPIL